MMSPKCHSSAAIWDACSSVFTCPFFFAMSNAFPVTPTKLGPRNKSSVTGFASFSELSFVNLESV